MCIWVYHRNFTGGGVRIINVSSGKMRNENKLYFFFVVALKQCCTFTEKNVA